MTTPDSEFADIQGLLWSGYGPLKEACFLLLRVTDAAAARAWLGATAGSITTIEKLRQARVSRALHIALTAGGMRALGVAENVIDGFSAEFIAGLAGDEGRSRRLGDVGSGAPSLWRWGGTQEPHMCSCCTPRRTWMHGVFRSKRVWAMALPCSTGSPRRTWAARSRLDSWMA